MESEKVKEIKKALEFCASLKKRCRDCDYNEIGCYKLLKDILTLINELESENEQLKNIGLTEEITVGEYLREMQRLKDRIAELEEALLDMVVQFCQMGEEGYLKHAFMSAEENAFDVLDINYGEKVADVYERFNKKWKQKTEVL